MNRSLMSVILDSAWYMLKEFIGINDAMNCFGGDMWACGSLIVGAIPWTKLGKIPGVLKAVNRTISAIQALRTAKRVAEGVLRAAKAAETAALNAKKLAIEKAKKAAQAAKKKAAQKAQTTSNKAVNATKKTGNSAQKNAQAKSNPKGSSAASSGAGKSGKSGGGSGKSGGGSGKSGGGSGKGDSKGGGDSGATTRGNGGSSGGSCPTPGNSFVPGTRVLMADGSTKPVEDVQPGDEVLVTDPETGETVAETVTAAITGDGVKKLVKVTIDTDGDRGTETAEITATDGHPFWVPELGEWIDATDLRSGQWLRTSSGTYVQIAAIERWDVLQATVHNLTVANIHTYYVVAGNTPVLVHNCNGSTNSHNADIPVHSDINKFNARAGELVNNRFETHPLNPDQMNGGDVVGHGGVRNLSNNDLTRPGGPQGSDPIRGARDWAPGDCSCYPASRIYITGGHHRTAEIARRVMVGDMSPDRLIEFVISPP